MKNGKNNIIQGLNKIIYSVLIISVVVYISTLHLRPYPFSYILKIIPVVSLMFIAYLNLPINIGRQIVIALIFSGIGDVILAIDGRGYFVFGLFSFAIAHCMYIRVFLTSAEWKSRRSALSLIFILYGAVFAFLVLPSAGKMMIPTTIYLLIITSMGISAVIGKNNHPIIILGASLFVISDSLIAINMFITKITFSSFWIMITYFPAQILITLGTIKSIKTHKEY